MQGEQLASAAAGRSGDRSGYAAGGEIGQVRGVAAGQFILAIKGTALVFLLGLTASQREIPSIAQDAAINDANLSPLAAAGILYLLLTVPMTYAVNAWGPACRLPRRAGAHPG